MAGKKKKAAGAPTWMVTFADMMALLLCLFVLLLSFSEMDVAKYKIVAGEMEQAFGMALKSRLTGVVEFRRTPERRAYRDARQQKPEEFIPLVVAPSMEKSDEYNIINPDFTAEDILAANLRDTLADEIDRGMLMLERINGDVVIRFPGHVVYPSGGANILPETLEALERVANALSETDGLLIVHFLLQSKMIDPSRISATGYADSRPLVPNDSDENRSKNRRVEISIRAQ